jgi:hypothetical protein
MEAGAASIDQLRERYSDMPEMQDALAQCVCSYTEGGATDFAMAGGCARNNETGLREMQQ